MAAEEDGMVDLNKMRRDLGDLMFPADDGSSGNANYNSQIEEVGAVERASACGPCGSWRPACAMFKKAVLLTHSPPPLHSSRSPPPSAPAPLHVRTTYYYARCTSIATRALW
jgi:hypothetical protein